MSTTPVKEEVEKEEKEKVEEELPKLEMYSGFRLLLKTHIKDEKFDIKNTKLSEESLKIRKEAINERIKSECPCVFDKIKESILKSISENRIAANKGCKVKKSQITFEVTARLIDIGINIKRFHELNIPDYYEKLHGFYSEICDYKHWLYTYEIYDYIEKELNKNGFEIKCDFYDVTHDGKFLATVTKFPDL